MLLATPVLAEDVYQGELDKSTWVVLINESDNRGTTGVAHSDVSCYYIRQGGSATSVTMANLASITASHSDGGWEEADSTNMPGVYRFDLPDAAFAVGADSVVVSCKDASGNDFFTYREKFPIVQQELDTGTFVRGIFQGAAGGSITISATSTSSSAALATNAGNVLKISNTGSAAVHFRVGAGSQTALTSDTVVAPNSVLYVPIDSAAAQIGMRTPSGTATVYVSRGWMPN